MKNALRSVAMAFSMFSRLPMPRVEWRPENMHYMLAAYPLVGVAEGALLLLWAWACRALAFGTALFAAGICGYLGFLQAHNGKEGPEDELD